MSKAHYVAVVACLQDGDEPGPDTELEYWRTRMSNFNSITEQLKTRECKLVLGICAAAKSKGSARWKSLDIQVRPCMVHSQFCYQGPCQPLLIQFPACLA